jgi:hypothetical protein
MESLVSDVLNKVASFLDTYSIVCLQNTSKQFSFPKQTIPRKICRHIIEYDSVTYIKWFVDLGCSLKDNKSSYDALVAKAPNVLEYLKFIGEYCHYHTNYIFGYDHHGNYYEHVSNKCAVKTLSWIFENNYTMSRDIIECACGANDFEAVKWLINKKYSVPIHICEIAARTGNLEMLRWLMNNRYKRSHGIREKAIISGNLKMCEWLEDVYFRNVNNWSCVSATAIEHGHVHILNWLKSKGYQIWATDIWYHPNDNLTIEALNWTIENLDKNSIKVIHSFYPFPQNIKDWAEQNDVEIKYCGN